MNTTDALKQAPNIEAVPASDFWLSIARQRLAEYHAQMSSPTIPRSSERFAELSRAMRTEASVLEHISKLFVVQWHADAPSINALPREILHYIFSLVAKIDRPCPPYDCRDHSAQRGSHLDYHERDHERDNTERYPALGKGGYLGWLRLGHVCQSWRNGLLGLPALWASEVGLLPRGLDVMLERAQNMPLSIRIYISTCRPEAAVVLDAMATRPTSSMVLQARELDIMDVRDADMEGLDALLNACTFPLIERAAIRGMDTGHLILRPMDSLPYICAPRLVSLHLMNTFYPWKSSVLTSLSVGDANEDTDIYFNAQHIGHILRTSASTLETLSLYGCYFTEDEAHPLEVYPGSNITRVTHVPKLQTLRIHVALDSPSDWEVYSWILASVSLPVTAKLMVTTITKYDGFPNGHTIRTVIKDCIQAREMCKLDVLAIGDEPLLFNPVEQDAYFAFAFHTKAIGSPALSLGAQEVTTLIQSPLLIVCKYSDMSDCDIGLEYLNALIKAASVCSQKFTTIAYMARPMFVDPEPYTATFSCLCAGTDVRTFVVRDVDLEWVNNDDEPMQDWRYLTDVLRGPVLPRLEHLTLHDIVDLARIPDILRSQVRSLGEAGHTAWKLRELRLNVVGKSGEVPSDHDGDDTVLIATLCEFADSVILSRV